MMDWGNLRNWITKKREVPKISSWAVTRSRICELSQRLSAKQTRMSNVAESGEEHSIIWRLFMSVMMNAATSMGKNFSTIQNFIMNSEDFTLKQMFDDTAQLVSDQEEIYGLDKIFNAKRILGNVCHWLVMKQLSIFKAQKSMSSRILCCASGGSFNFLIPTKLGRTELQRLNPRRATEIMVVSMESRPNSSGISSQDSQRCSYVKKSMIYWATCGRNTRNIHRKNSFHVNVQ